MKPPPILKKYDEEIEGEKKESFSLGRECTYVFVYMYAFVFNMYVVEYSLCVHYSPIILCRRSR